MEREGGGVNVWPFLILLAVLIVIGVRALRRWHEANALIAMYERARVREAALAYRQAMEKEGRGMVTPIPPGTASDLDAFLDRLTVFPALYDPEAATQPRERAVPCARGCGGWTWHVTAVCLRCALQEAGIA